MDPALRAELAPFRRYHTEVWYSSLTAAQGRPAGCLTGAELQGAYAFAMHTEAAACKRGPPAGPIEAAIRAARKLGWYFAAYNKPHCGATAQELNLHSGTPAMLMGLGGQRHIQQQEEGVWEVTNAP